MNSGRRHDGGGGVRDGGSGWGVGVNGSKVVHIDGAR